MRRAFNATNIKDRIAMITNMMIACQHNNLIGRKAFIPYIGETLTAYMKFEDPEFKDTT